MNGPWVAICVLAVCMAAAGGWLAHETVDYMGACYAWALAT